MMKPKALLFVIGTTFFASGVFAGPLDINSATAVNLADNIQGVGPKLAQAIVDYREENGPVLSVEALMDVTGVGPTILEENLDVLLIRDRVGEKESVEATN